MCRSDDLSPIAGPDAKQHQRGTQGDGTDKATTSEDLKLAGTCSKRRPGRRIGPTQPTDTSSKSFTSRRVRVALRRS
jgi:hypothetical protein